jgi:hypothetical protein
MREFAHGKVTNWFGGSSNATTRLLDEMQYRGLLRVARREGGTRVYAARESSAESPKDDATIASRLDALVDIVVNKYAPLPASSLGRLLSYLCVGVPQWRLRRAATLARAKRRLAHTRAGGEDWYWPEAEDPASRRWRPDDAVRLLTPFDPIVFDRRRFEIFWGWPYRFEAYLPPSKRKLGYYALPLLWRDNVVGWGNLAVRNGDLACSLGYVKGAPPEALTFAKGSRTSSTECASSWDQNLPEHGLGLVALSSDSACADPPYRWSAHSPAEGDWIEIRTPASRRSPAETLLLIPVGILYARPIRRKVAQLSVSD